jgi:hypothetical protein
VLVILLATGVTTRAQQTPMHQLQAVVTGLQDPQQARQLSLLLDEQAGVVISRLDVHTRNLMAQVHPSCSLDHASLNALLAPYGVRVRCVTRSVVGAAPFQHLDPATCREPDQSR